MTTIQPVFGPKNDEESHRLVLKIDFEDGAWFWKFTCPKCPEYINLRWADGRNGKLKTVPGIHHWFNGTFTKHLEKN